MKKTSMLLINDRCLHEIIEKIKHLYWNSGKTLEVTVGPQRRNKSQQQLGWIWGSAYPEIQKHWEIESGVTYKIPYIHEWCIRTYSRINPSQIEMQIEMYDSVVHCSELRLSEMTTIQAVEYQSWLMDFFPTKGLFLRPPESYD